jgi:hypothetical protein
MPNLYDLSKISEVIRNKNITRILVVDTNVVMNNPELDNWEIASMGSNLFILSDLVIQELEHIKQKKGSPENLESSNKARKAISNIIKTFSLGDVTCGIPIKSGWVISVRSPRKDDINPELEQLEDVVSAFKRSDAKLLLLTRECYQTFQSIPVILLTGDGNFSNQVKMHGVPCHIVYSFPIQVLSESNALTHPIDWKRIIDGMETNAKEIAIVVEATLLEQKLSPSWTKLVNYGQRYIIAEGTGVVRGDNFVRPFIWTTRFYPQTLEKRLSDDDKYSVDMPSIYLDFFGEDDFDQDVFDAIADKLLDCTTIQFAEGIPTLQSPKSIMEILILMEYLHNVGITPDAKENLLKDIVESGSLVNYWSEWILNTEDTDEKFACLQGFVEALNECWEIGQTYKFSIMKNP